MPGWARHARWCDALVLSIASLGGEFVPVALGGRSWDEANPSEGGKVACKAYKACKARLFEGLA